MTDYLAGRRTGIDLPVTLRGTAEQRRVWQLLNTIGYGETVTYGEFAALLAGGTTTQQVGQLVGRNPLSIVFPCHRVMGRDGRLTGYAGGLVRKQYLLSLEEPSEVTAARLLLRPDRVAPPSRRGRLGRDHRRGQRLRRRALLPQLLTSAEAGKVRDMYADDDRFRATIDMRRYRFSEGEDRYFKASCPKPIEALKQALYPRLLPIARDWWQRLGRAAPWPDTLDDWLEMCHSAGQSRSTAILLRYRAGDWNALHRDLYGDLVFPLEVVINLSEPGVDHTGGEVLLAEQRPRAQSRGTATLMLHGHGFVFTTRERPVRSTRGWSAAPVRHGVSAVRSGERFTLGLVFHDAA